MILTLIVPFTVPAQEAGYGTSSSDYLWMNVGTAGFSAGEINDISLAFMPSGEPYVAVSDHTFLDHSSVMKFDGANWVTIGNEGFSAGESVFLSLAINSAGVPYVAYSDGGNDSKATVMKYDSVNVGINTFHDSELGMYPNHASTLFSIESIAPAQLSILSLTGVPLITRQLTESTTTLEISTLPAGVYVVKVAGEKGVQVGKLIKK